jgi:hypothetical protein
MSRSSHPRNRSCPEYARYIMPAIGMGWLVTLRPTAEQDKSPGSARLKRASFKSRRDPPWREQHSRMRNEPIEEDE